MFHFFSSIVWLGGDFELPPFTHGGFLTSAHQGLLPVGQIGIFWFQYYLEKMTASGKNLNPGFRKLPSGT